MDHAHFNDIFKSDIAHEATSFIEHIDFTSIYDDKIFSLL
jgi:hypothetical protein